MLLNLMLSFMMMMFFFFIVPRYVEMYQPGRYIAKLLQYDESWFQDVVHASGLKDLCRTEYGYINYGLLSFFKERWHIETSSFHLPIGEMSITLVGVSSLIHLPITRILLNYSRCSRVEAFDMIVTYFGADLCDV